MGQHCLERIVSPRSIVIFGVNDNVMTMGSTQLLNIITSGYKGDIYPVHPRLDTVLGLKAYKSLAEIPDHVQIDLAFIVIPSEAALAVLEQCGKRGITSAVLITAGFRELGNTSLNQRLVSIAREHGIRFIGPNCIGFFNNFVGDAGASEPSEAAKASDTSDHSRYTTINTTWIPINPPRGGVSIASQSGTFACHVFFETARLGMGMCKTISIGNEASIDIVDCLEFLEQDPHTKVIALYIEEIKRGREFMKVAARIARKKPIVAMYVGGTEAGARAVKSHTGSMGGSDLVFNAMARQVGIIRAYTMEEWLDYAYALDRCPVPKGNRIAIFTNAGGPGVNMSDVAERLGLRVPVFSESLQDSLRKKIKNPTAQVRNIVDVTFDVDIEGLYRTVPRTIMKSEEIDGMIVYGIFGWSFFDNLRKIAPPGIDVPIGQMRDILTPLLEHFAKLPKVFGKPLLAVNLMGRDEEAVQIVQDRGIPVFPMPSRVVKAFWALDQYRQILERFKLKDVA